MASEKGTLYTGHTNDLRLAVHRHRTKERPGEYEAKRLVYYEVMTSERAAQNRADEIRAWPRAKKVEAINAVNPKWDAVLV